MYNSQRYISVFNNLYNNRKFLVGNLPARATPSKYLKMKKIVDIRNLLNNYCDILGCEIMLDKQTSIIY